MKELKTKLDVNKALVKLLIRIAKQPVSGMVPATEARKWILEARRLLEEFEDDLAEMEGR